MRIVFMGTPDFSVGALEALIEAGHEIAAVVTQPDKPKGRSGPTGEGMCAEAWAYNMAAPKDQDT